MTTESKGYIERLIKTYQAECLRQEQPETEEAAREVTEAFLRHYQAERPRPATWPGQPATAGGVPHPADAASAAGGGGS